MKIREQLNGEYTPTRKYLTSCCGQIIRQTGRGAPAIDAFVTTMVNIETAWQHPQRTLEEVVRELIQHHLLPPQTDRSGLFLR